MLPLAKKISLGLGILTCLALAMTGWLLSARADEVGTNDFRISDMGPDGNANFGVSSSLPAVDVAYNSTNDEYLVVWPGDDDENGLVDGEDEIFGQRIDAATGAEIGGDFRISDMGPDGNAAYDASTPYVAYNPINNEYLVIWKGDDNTGSLVDNEYEVFGQRIDAATGTEVGNNDFRISDMGPDGNSAFIVYSADVVHNATNNEYLVTWYGEDNTGLLVDGELEAYIQRIDGATGAEIGTNDFRISDAGPDGDAAYMAAGGKVAYNSANNEYLVVWVGDDNVGALVDNEQEVFGQRIDAATGAEIGTNDFRISDMGPDGNAAFDANGPLVGYNPAHNEYLVHWNGDDNTGSLVDDEFEGYIQRIDGTTGAEVGTNDFRISDMGPDGNANFDGNNASLVYNAANDEYLVVWTADDNENGLVDEEREVFGQRIDAATGAEVGTNDFRISDMGPNGNTNFGPASFFRPFIAYNPTNNEYLVVWVADDNENGLVDNEYEVFGQRLTFPVCGNGFVDIDEVCDDGGESADCNPDCTAASCGDGFINATAGEECDAAGANSDVTSDACRSDCVAAFCGDGVTDTGEGCDDGNADDTDSCLDTCVSATCGDGSVEVDVEECDNGGSNSDTVADACRSNCTDHRCGDAVTDTSEECDDGNVAGGDGCNALCGIEGTPAGGEVASDNSEVNFDHLRTGETILLSAPDPRNLSALTIKETTLPDTCSCAWSVDPESIGTFSDSAACETQFTLAEEGEGILGVSVDCGAEGSGTFQQSLTVVQPWGVAGIGGCNLIVQPQDLSEINLR